MPFLAVDTAILGGFRGFMYNLLIDKKKELGLTNEDIVQRTGVSMRTVERIFSKNHQEHKRGCSVDTLRPILNLLGLSFEDIFDDAKVFIGGHAYTEMQDKIRALQERISTVTAERDFANADNLVLKSEITALTAEIKLLNMQLAYKDEIISLYKRVDQNREIP